MEQKLNSSTTADVTKSSHTCTKPMLATRAYLETFKIKNI